MPKIKVRSIPSTFRRAGLSFNRNGAEYDVDAKQLKILQAEPMLFVEILPEAPKEKDQGKEKK
jgi:hypothetical protein